MQEDKFQKLSPVRVFEQAVEQIRELIFSGIFAPGEKLPTEKELSRQLDVSRSSVREALRVLEAEGIIEVKRGAGAFVTSNPLQNTVRIEYVRWLAKREESLIQLLQVRESMEGLTASLAATRAGKEVVEQLREILAQQTKIIEESEVDPEGNIDELARLDQDFHLAISAASGNDIASEIISHIFPAYNQSNKAVIYVGGRQGRMVNEHWLIFNAIESRDPVAAEKAMRAHIARVRSEIPTTNLEVADNQ